MHIPDGYLGPETYGSLWAASIAIWFYASKKIKEELSASQVPFLAMSSAFSFIVMIFTIPLPGGTTGHITGGTLISILLGPWAAVIAVSIALIIQALLFGDGGITAVGANCFNIAFIGSVTGYGTYAVTVKILSRLMGRRRSPEIGFGTESVRVRLAGAALGSYVGINAAGLFTAVELGIQPLLHASGPGGGGYFPFPLSVAVPAVMVPHLTAVGALEAVVAALVLLFLHKAQPHLIRPWKAAKVILLASFLLLQASDLSAHEFWIEHTGKDFTLIHGHGTHREDFDISRVKDVKAFDTKGNLIEVQQEKKDKGLLLRSASQPALVLVGIDNGYWSKTIYGWKNLPKRQARRVVEAIRSLNYSKALVAWSDFTQKPLAEAKLDILPLKNPFDLKAGDRLPVKVLYQGSPLPHVEVEGADHDTVSTTDKNGVAQVKISRGYQVITVTYKEPLKDNPDADFFSTSTTLTFEVKQ
jgi:cobalt/nickel transport system permease protein